MGCRVAGAGATAEEAEADAAGAVGGEEDAEGGGDGTVADTVAGAAGDAVGSVAEPQAALSRAKRTVGEAARSEKRMDAEPGPDLRQVQVRP